MRPITISVHIGRRELVCLITSVVILLGVGDTHTEKTTLTTYYPAPYGAYRELRATQNAYLAYTSGRVGVGTSTPAAKLDVNGDMSTTLMGLKPQNHGTAGGAILHPPGGTAGQVYFNDIDKSLYLHDGTAWSAMSTFDGKDIKSAGPIDLQLRKTERTVTGFNVTFPRTGLYVISYDGTLDSSGNETVITRLRNGTNTLIRDEIDLAAGTPQSFGGSTLLFQRKGKVGKFRLRARKKNNTVTWARGVTLKVVLVLSL